ncbi:Hypothetical_protein [Hexamita inflata]|uniref:Hypothetical_protein n=1 Tax=Hexamita inflata TaxID=28002 RepID=A0AA86NT67_9EUKA|nr:Hypothetical protein HINF_LOCUS12414 [Hexamita inflata]
MLNCLVISLLQLEAGPQFACDKGFIIQDSHCVCQKCLSANGTLCVENCSDINEVEINGECSALKSKSSSGCASYGIGFTFDDNLNSCACPLGSLCHCISEKCCAASGLHYLNKQCDSCVNMYGTGWVWSATNNYCMCHDISKCACTTQWCCTQTKLQVLVKGQCTTCTGSALLVSIDEQFGYCGCPAYYNYYGSINKPGDVCTQCPELLNENEDGCISCQEAFGPGYTWSSSKGTCVCPQGANCECKTSLCCFKIHGTNYLNGVCQSCEDIYQEGAILDVDTGKCKCDSSKYYGTLDKQGDTCNKCDQYLNPQGTACQTCENDYGTGYSWSTNTKKCVCSQGSSCTCTSNICCANEQASILDTTCKSCSSVYGDGAILSQQSCTCNIKKNYYGQLTQASSVCQLCEGVLNVDSTCSSCSTYGSGYIWDTNTKKCYCPAGVPCECKSEECCQQFFSHFINNKCGRCLDRIGPGYYWDDETNNCKCINQIQCECVTDYCCTSFVPNSHMNQLNQQCDCNSGYKFINGVCKKSSNKVVGLAVGIPLGFLFLLAIIIIIVLKKKQKKQNEPKEETKETVQVATETETVQIAEPVIETVPEVEQPHFPVQITE